MLIYVRFAKWTIPRGFQSRKWITRFRCASLQIFPTGISRFHLAINNMIYSQNEDTLGRIYENQNKSFAKRAREKKKDKDTERERMDCLKNAREAENIASLDASDTYIFKRPKNLFICTICWSDSERGEIRFRASCAFMEDEETGNFTGRLTMGKSMIDLEWSTRSTLLSRGTDAKLTSNKTC